MEVTEDDPATDQDHVAEQPKFGSYRIRGSRYYTTATAGGSSTGGSSGRTSSGSDNHDHCAPFRHNWGYGWVDVTDDYYDSATGYLYG